MCVTVPVGRGNQFSCEPSIPSNWSAELGPQAVQKIEITIIVSSVCRRKSAFAPTISVRQLKRIFVYDAVFHYEFQRRLRVSQNRDVF